MQIYNDSVNSFPTGERLRLWKIHSSTDLNPPKKEKKSTSKLKCRWRLNLILYFRIMISYISTINVVSNAVGSFNFNFLSIYHRHAPVSASKRPLIAQ